MKYFWEIPLKIGRKGAKKRIKAMREVLPCFYEMFLPLVHGASSKEKLLPGFYEMVFPLEHGSSGQGGRGDSDLPLCPPWTPLAPKGAFPLVSPPAGSVSGTHFAWHISRGTYCNKVFLP